MLVRRKRLTAWLAVFNLGHSDVIRRFVSRQTPRSTGMTIGRLAVFWKRKRETAYQCWIPAFAGMTDAVTLLKVQVSR